MKRLVILVAFAPIALLSGCLMSDPEGTPAGLVGVNGHIATVIPNCQGEQIVGIKLELDPDVDLSLPEADRILWRVSQPKDPMSLGPFILGDNSPWNTVSKDLDILPQKFTVTVETNKGHAVSVANQSDVLALRSGQILIGSENKVGSQEELAKSWNCT